MRRAKETRDRDKTANGVDVGGIQRNKIDVIRDCYQIYLQDIKSHDVEFR